MRVAALYDIHGNLPALEAALRGVRQAGVDQILVGGDVLPGPMPRETLECLTSLDLPAVHPATRPRGDHADRRCSESFRDVMRWNAEQLSLED
jgi:hypothetical protein